jgi:nucleoside-diphosphate-sugar epimerase
VTQIKNKILVFGSGGFIGQNLLRELSNSGAQVVIGTTKSNVGNISEDQIIGLNTSIFKIITSTFRHNPDKIVYLSSKFVRDSIIMNIRVNFFLPVLIGIYARVNRKQYIFVVSYWQLMPKLTKKFLNRYTLTKYFSTLILKFLALKSSSPINIFYLGNTFGQKDSRNNLIPYVIQCIKNGENIKVLNPKNYAAYSDIKLVIELLLNILKKPAKLEYYCINKSAIRVDELVNLLKEIYVAEKVILETNYQNRKILMDTKVVLSISDKFTQEMFELEDFMSQIKSYYGSI